MHQLFRLVLAQKDLSRAGDLFSLTDAEIERGLTDALEQLQIISSAPDYRNNANDQAVVEICITRITTALRGTGSIERHARALVELWASCLEHELCPSGRDEDTPHAKIASDVMSCILQNYSRPPVMALAVPVAIRFLQRGSRELVRTMSNYLSLAAVSQAELLAEHTEAIMRSIMQGNTVLLRVLPAVYDLQPGHINSHLPGLLALLVQLEQPEQYHLLWLVHKAAKRKQVEAVQKCIPLLVGHLLDSPHPDVILNTLLEIAGYAPATLRSSLPALSEAAERRPCLLGQTARIYGAVGLVDEESARSCLTFLVAQLASTEHSCHHILLLEIKHLTDTFTAILGPHGTGIFHLCNSFSAIAKFLTRQLDTDLDQGGRDQFSTETDCPKNPTITKLAVTEKEDPGRLLVKPQTFEDKPCSTSNTSISLRRCGSRAWDTLPTEDARADDGGVEEDGDSPSSVSLSEAEQLSSSKADTDQSQLGSTIDLNSTIIQIDSENEEGSLSVHLEDYQDRLYLHLQNNLSRVKAYVLEMAWKIPIPNQCIIEGSKRSFVAKMIFTCSLKGPYCLYSKSSFVLVSPNPQPWLKLMFLFQQSLLDEPLYTHSSSVQHLQGLWEKIRVEGELSFEDTLLQRLFLRQKELDRLQLCLQEVRFFDVFGLNKTAGLWQCFMCNNPERAAVVNQEGQPLMEGRLKEKQVKWKFIKRWKTRYFTLAGNPLLFQKGRRKEDPEDFPIELSKIQSVRVVPKKRRDHSLPRAFEIFTDHESYIFKAKDERDAEQWLQCLNVAMAQVRERESREVSTYL